MKKKGFTLIELLAVIIILAILALILTPMIQDLILNAKKAAFERSIDGIMSAAEYYMMEHNLDNEVVFTCDGTTCEDEDGNKLVFNGEVPISGTITASGAGVVAENVCNNSFCGNGSKEGLVISNGGATPSDNASCNTAIFNYLTASNGDNIWVYDYLDSATTTNISIEDNHVVFEYDYTGSYQTFKAPVTGTYKIETWGAQGGNGGYGGYSTGDVNLTKGETIYLVVGGKGTAPSGITGGSGGFNGGGSGGNGSPYVGGGGGGGATHIATTLIGSGELKEYESYQDRILIVSGGGGGYGCWAFAGHGGGFAGTNSGSDDEYNGRSAGSHSIGGNQTTGFAFGLGGNGGIGINGDTCGSEGKGGGGGGFYGGYAYTQTGAYSDDAGAGGSSYIANQNLNSKAMYCYDCEEDLENIDTYTISTTGDNKDENICPDGYSSDPVSKCAKSGNGYIKITYVKNCGAEEVVPTDRTQIFVAPKSGTYKIEVWGAQGGDYKVTDKNGYSCDNKGGSGGYSTANIHLDKNNALYINVGGAGTSLTANSSDYHQSGVTGGYNGGGSGGDGASWGFPGGTGGGGATHITTSLISTGELKHYVDAKDKVLIVAGGGGGAGWETVGGAGGGLNGVTVSDTYASTGGTQDSGYAFGVGSPGYTGHDVPGSSEGSGGSGSGYYGGSTYVATGNTHESVGGAGGSGYIGTLSNASTLDGNQSMPTHDGTSTMIGNRGNGYAKITFISN